MKEVVTYDIYIDDNIENGVDKISLVKKGAILTDFIFMDELESLYKQVILSDDKRIITGPALIPDLAIIRQDSKDEEPYYIKYSSDQIEQIVQKFAKLKTNHNVNKNHKQDVEDTYIYESWLTGKSDKSTELGFDVPVGTWMVSMKVEDDEIWDSIKTGKYKGFSIEGLFKFKRSSKLVKQDQGDKISFDYDGTLTTSKGKEEAIKQIESGSQVYIISARDSKDGIEKLASELNIPMDHVYATGDNKSKIEKIHELGITKHYDNNSDVIKELGNIGVELVHPTSGETHDDFISRCMGSKIMTDEYSETDQRYAVCESNWKTKQELQLEDKKIIKNMISSILKDGNTLYTNADKFDVGSEVYFMEGESTRPVDDGEYTLEDGTVLTIKGSIIETMTPVVAAEVEAPIDEVKQAATLDDLFALLTEINGKLDLLTTTETTEDTTDSTMMSKLEAIEVQLEKVIVEKENKNVEVIDNKKNISQTKVGISYEDMKKINRKF